MTAATIDWRVWAFTDDPKEAEVIAEEMARMLILMANVDSKGPMRFY